MLQRWGIDTRNLDQEWKEADKDGKGQVLFEEFVNWAFAKQLDLDNDDNADDFDVSDSLKEVKAANLPLKA